MLSLLDTFRILATLRSGRLTVRPRRLCRWGKIYGGVRRVGCPSGAPPGAQGGRVRHEPSGPGRVRRPLITAPGGAAEGATMAKATNTRTATTAKAATKRTRTAAETEKI